MKADHYDGFAESHSADSEANLINGYYERPATVELAERRSAAARREISPGPCRSAGRPFDVWVRGSRGGPAG